MPYVLVSLKHTSKTDLFVTLWRKDNSGYQLSSEKAGVYKEIEEGYHNSESTLPVTVDAISKLFIDVNYDNRRQKMIPNCEAVWRELGLKMTKKGLQRV